MMGFRCQLTIDSHYVRRMLGIVYYGLLSCLPSLVSASPYQLRDVVIYGANRFQIEQLPLSEIVKSSKVPITVPASVNNKGYQAVWLIQGNVLFLKSFKAESNGKPVKIEQLIPEAKLPLRAKWFSGDIELPVGEFDEETNTLPVVVTLKVLKGKVVKVDAKESVKVK